MGSLSQLLSANGGAVSMTQFNTVGKKLFKEVYPEYLINGPWHINSKVFLGIIAMGMVTSAFKLKHDSKTTTTTTATATTTTTTTTSQEATTAAGDCHATITTGTNRPTSSSNPKVLSDRTSNLFKMIGAILGTRVLKDTIQIAGPWTLYSYTLMSWNLSTLRYVLGVFEDPDAEHGTIRKWISIISDHLRFPALVQNSVTVSVWWLVIFPLVLLRMKDPTQRMNFFKHNLSSYLLVTLHGLNLPFAGIDHLLHPRLLTLKDLWIGLTISFCYLTFYLGYLDRAGLPLYIILTPRLWGSFLVYGGIIATYYGFYKLWNLITCKFAKNIHGITLVEERKVDPASGTTTTSS